MKPVILNHEGSLTAECHDHLNVTLRGEGAGHGEQALNPAIDHERKQHMTFPSTPIDRALSGLFSIEINI